MACCALAAFLLGQILLLWGKARGWLGGAPAGEARAAAWRPDGKRAGDNAAEFRPRSRWRRMRLRFGTVLAALGAAGLAGAAVAASQTGGTVELGDTGIRAPVCGEVDGFFANMFLGRK